MDTPQQNYNLQKKLAIVTASIFLIKLLAWYLTHSVAILSDMLEYIINVVSGFVGLYSLHHAARPRDYNHPYGHGKVEFLSAAIEGTLMIVSGMLIIYEAVHHLLHPFNITKLDYGIWLLVLTALVNYAMGYYAFKRGHKTHSLALQASGTHMQTDTYATLGVIGGLILLYITKYNWLDGVVALVSALIIIVSGSKILRSSIAGIMDEADEKLLAKVVALCNASRTENWVDMHNLRIIKYGSILHLDCHLTVPWYFNVRQVHDEIDLLSAVVKDKYGASVELFVHTDPCLNFSCPICTKQDCNVRQSPFIQRIEWTVDNISANTKHSIITGNITRS